MECKLSRPVLFPTYNPTISKFTENDQELMKSNLSKADFEKPLFLSLATSPLILLRSTLLTKKTLNKGDIFEVRSVLRQDSVLIMVRYSPQMQFRKTRNSSG